MYDVVGTRVFKSIQKIEQVRESKVHRTKTTMLKRLEGEWSDTCFMD